MEQDMMMRMYPISRASVEKCRDATENPKFHEQFSEIIGVGERTKMFRVAIIPDFQAHMGLVSCGTIQYVFPLLELRPILTELISNGKGDELVQAFSESVTKATETFTKLFVNSSPLAILPTEPPLEEKDE